MRYITLYNQHMVNLAQRRPNKTHQAQKSGQWGCGLSATETGSMFLHIIGELICNRSTCGRDVENANPWGRWYQLNVRMYNPDWNLFFYLSINMYSINSCFCASVAFPTQTFWQPAYNTSLHWSICCPCLVKSVASCLGQDRGSHWSHDPRDPRASVTRPATAAAQVALRCVTQTWVCQKQCGICGEMGFNEISWDWTVNSGDLANKNCDLMWF